jgi:hypothetical protein
MYWRCMVRLVAARTPFFAGLFLWMRKVPAGPKVAPQARSKLHRWWRQQLIRPAQQVAPLLLPSPSLVSKARGPAAAV